jgi:Ca-activated chloride channel family protein
VVEVPSEGPRRFRLGPAERLDRDFILRFRVHAESIQTGLSLHRRPGDAEGTFALTVVPPDLKTAQVRPRDVLLLLDRSGSMEGWKMAAARRAAGRFLDSLTEHDRFGILAFDDRLEQFEPQTASSLVPATDRARFRGVEYLSQLEARGGTEMANPLQQAVARLKDAGHERDRVVVLITDGQVGNEDELLWIVRQQLAGIRIFSIGIDQAVNGSFLRRLAEPTGGTCELVESEDRLDDCMRSAFRRIGCPVLTRIDLSGGGLTFTPDDRAPEGTVDAFPGTPAVLMGRFTGTPTGPVTVTATTPDGHSFTDSVTPTSTEDAGLTVAWARARLLDMEYHYVASGEHDSRLAERITAFSLAHRVMCRFTAFVAVDPSETRRQTAPLHRLTQPVETPGGWSGSLAKRSASTLNCSMRAAPPSAARPAAPMSASSCSPSTPPVLSRVLEGLESFFGGNTHEEPTIQFAAEFAGPIRSLVDKALPRIRQARVAAELAQELRYLASDLADLAERVRACGALAKELSELESLLKQLEAIPQDRRVPGDETILKFLAKLEAFLDPSAQPASPKPATQRDFWK